MRRRELNTKMINRGMTATAEPAMSAPHSVSTGLCTLRNARGKVYISGVRITTSGPMKLFHEAMKVMSPSVPNAGPSSGTTTRQ